MEVLYQGGWKTYIHFYKKYQREKEYRMETIQRGKIYSRPRMDLGKIVPVREPFSLEIDVCSLCNLQCKFCFHSDTKQRTECNFKQKIMSFDLYKKIIDDSKNFEKPVKKLKLYVFGEPLLHPNLPEMIQYAKEKEVAEYIEITTNGIALTAKLSQSLIRAGLDRINISINGLDNQDYIKNCKREVDFLRLQKEIEYLFSIREKCWIYIKLGDTGYSEDQKKMFYQIFEGICDEIFIENIVDNAWDSINIQEKDNSCLFGSYHQVMVEKKVCPFLFTRMIVNVEGFVSLCCIDWKGEYVLGDLNKETIVDIWNGENLRKLQLLHLLGKRKEMWICKNCRALSAFTIDNIDKDIEEIRKRMENGRKRE